MNQNHQYLFKMATISTHTVLKSLWPPINPSMEIPNTSTGKSAAAFRRDHFKFSILGCLLLASHLLKIGPQFVKGFRSELAEGQSEVEMKSGTFVSCHCWVVCALCAGAESCWKLQFCPRKRMLQEETSQYWKFKVVSLEGSCKFSSWCVV